MWMIVASALAARRGQAITIALVTMVACAALAVGAASPPAAVEDVRAAGVAGAPVPERLIAISRRQSGDQTGSPDPVPALRRSFAPEGFTGVAGGHASGDLDSAVWGAASDVVLAHREGVCDALVVVTGDCPAVAGEVLVPADRAATAGVGPGDEVEITQPGADPRPLRVVGSYQVSDPTSPYWADGALVGLGTAAAPDRLTLFTAPETLLEYERVTYTYDLVATPEAFRGAEAAQVWAALTAPLAEVRRQGFAAPTDDLEALVERIGRDQRNVTVGAAVGVAILLLFTWFTLMVASRGAVVQIRRDVGWWRLHGVPSGRGWLAVIGQGAVPLFVGAAAGTLTGLLLAARLETGADGRRTTLVLALALAGLAVAGGLVAVVTTQAGALRAPVRDLIRRVPARSARWRRSVVDLVLVVVGVAAVGQALVTGGAAQGLAQLAPALVTLVVALVAAWVLPPLIASAGGQALRVGRLTTALVAASMTRRPGGHRMFAVVAVAVGLVTTGLVEWDTHGRAEWQRAAHESGADRVVTVAPVDPAQLLAAVRSVDPAGTEAMAVVRRPRVGGQPPVLAVDSARLGVVVDWREEYGGEVARVAAALRPTEPDPVTASTDRISVTAAATDPTGAEVRLRLLWYVVDTGEPVTAVVGPFTGAPRTRAADLPGCGAGCRLAGVQVIGPEDAEGATAGGYLPPGDGTWVEVHGLTAGDGTEVAPAVLRDPTRWRPGVGGTELGPALTAGDSGLRVTVPPPAGGLVRDDWAYLVDAPIRPPVVSADWRRRPLEEIRLAALPGEPVPVDVVMTTSLLPFAQGDGVLVDLEYVDRLRPASLPASGAEVWLAPTAPDSIVDALREAGLTPLRQESRSGNLSRLEAEGAAVAVRFHAAVAVIGLLLAAGVVVVLAAQDRAGRAAELGALRAQGVDARVIRAVGYGGVIGVVGAAVVVGLLAGLLGAVVARTLRPGFVDGWQLLPTPPPHPYPMVAAAALAVAVLGVAAVAAAISLLRRSRETTS